MQPTQPSSDMELLGTYRYTYGAGGMPNREIRFLRRPGVPASIFAQVWALNTPSPTLTSTVTPQAINVEMMSTTDRMQAMLLERSGHAVTMEPSRALWQLDDQSQRDILTQLGRPYRVEVINSIGYDPRFELVVKLNIINPG